jgi:hypothetical protein
MNLAFNVESVSLKFNFLKNSSKMKRLFVLVFVVVVFLSVDVKAQFGMDVNMPIPPFTAESAAKFSLIALDGIHSKMTNADGVKSEVLGRNDQLMKQLPAFYGNGNWYASVQSHWLLVNLLKQYPQLATRSQIVEMLSRTLTESNIRTETAFMKTNSKLDTDRVYGWAWVLKLSAELAQFDDPIAKVWLRNLQPLNELVKGYYYDYLPSLYYPVRNGGKSNTAFVLAFALDYARIVDDKTFENFLTERAKFYFSNDKSIPASWEPDGDDFLSPSLVVADLMRRVLTADEFVRWFKNFLPDLPFSLLHPVVVTKRSAGSEMNLDVLNITRAWHMFGLSIALPGDSEMHRDLWQAGYRHASESLPNVLYDEQGGSSILAAYAVCMYLALPH